MFYKKLNRRKKCLAKESAGAGVTEKDPNFEKSDDCSCTGSCRTRSCNCFKYNSGCVSYCKCAATCENIFNHLEYFFGEDETCDATPCFAKWLKGRNADGVKEINRDHLRRRIMKCGK